MVVLRWVVPLDAAASSIMVVLALTVVSVFAVVDVPGVLVWVFGLLVVVYAALLALLGAVIAGVLLRRMARGDDEFPASVWAALHGKAP